MSNYGGQPCKVILKRQKGVAVVEFAIGVIIILVLMLAAAEAGRAFYTYNTLTKSVRNGARYLASNVLTSTLALDLDDDKIADVRNLVIYGQLQPGTPILPAMIASSIDVVEASPSGAGRPYIQVTANYGYTPLFGTIPALGLGGSSHNFAFTMVARSTMRVLRGPKDDEV